MADRLSWLSEVATATSPYIPPAIGALIGLRYAKDQTPLQKCVSWGIGTMTGLYVGGLVAEWLSLGPRSSIGMGFLLGVAGYDLMVAVTAAARSPLETFRAWWSAWRGQQ